MGAQYVRRAYGVDYKRGDRVTVDGKPGTIVSFPEQYLGVRFDGERRVSRAHPTWRVERIAGNATPPTDEVDEDCGCRVSHPRWCAWNGPCCDRCSHGADEAHEGCCGVVAPPVSSGGGDDA